MKPVLLLIPGRFNTADIWQPVVERLGTQVDVPIADPLTQQSISAMASDAWRLVADLPSHTPLVVAGFLIGGYVAIELLAAHRDQVHAAAFVDTSAKVETAESTRWAPRPWYDSSVPPSRAPSTRPCCRKPA